MGDIKQFTTTPRANKNQIITFEVDGETWNARPVKQAKLLSLWFAIDRDRTSAEALHTDYDFMETALDEASLARMVERLEDSEDDFDHNQVVAIARYLVQSMTGNPTNGSAVSSPGPNGTGTSSTDEQPLPESTS